MKSVCSNALGGLIALAPTIAVAEMQAQEALALANVTVISPCEAPPWGPATILIREGRIAVVDSTHKVTIPPDAETQDLSGTYVIPGLIDGHMHIFHGVGSAAAVDTMRLHLEVLLSMGVTTVRDMAGDARVLRRLAEEERAGAEVPRIFFSALFAGPQQFARDPRGAAASQGVPPGTAPWMRSVSDTTNVEAVIRDAKETGAAGIKLYADLGEETVERLAMEAKREGMRVWSHARIRPLPARRVVTTGVETVSHAHHFLDEIEPAEAARFRQAVDRDSTTQLASPRLREVFDAMAERGVIFDPTLSLYEREENGRLRVAGAIVRAARDAGVRILAGTDPSGEDTAEIPLVHRELELLVEYGGLTPMEALKAATCVAADALGIRQRLGSVSVGQLGDLVVLGSDPLERISNVRDIRLVIKGGSIIRKPSP